MRSNFPEDTNRVKIDLTVRKASVTRITGTNCYVNIGGKCSIASTLRSIYTDSQSNIWKNDPIALEIILFLWKSQTII